MGYSHGGGGICCSFGCFGPSAGPSWGCSRGVGGPCCSFFGCPGLSAGPGWGRSHLLSVVPRSSVRGFISAGSSVSCSRGSGFVSCSFSCFGPSAGLGWGRSRGVGGPFCIFFVCPGPSAGPAGVALAHCQWRLGHQLVPPGTAPVVLQWLWLDRQQAPDEAAPFVAFEPGAREAVESPPLIRGTLPGP